KFGKTSFGLPTMGWGWTDYSGKHGGIGMGYVNRQGIQMMFDLEPTPNGMIQGWHLFDTRGYWSFADNSLENLLFTTDYQRSLRIQPSEPGNNFTTDEWLIIPHAGDWHRTADAYRERYVEVFKNDYMDWHRLPPKVKNQYFQLGIPIGEQDTGNHYPRGVTTHLDSSVALVKAALRGTAARADRTSVHVVFFNPYVARYPEFFPVYEAAGGEVGWKRMMDGLRQMGMSFIIAYTHLSYDHPAAKN